MIIETKIADLCLTWRDFLTYLVLFTPAPLFSFSQTFSSHLIVVVDLPLLPDKVPERTRLNDYCYNLNSINRQFWNWVVYYYSHWRSFRSKFGNTMLIRAIEKFLKFKVPCTFIYWQYVHNLQIINISLLLYQRPVSTSFIKVSLALYN